MPAQPNDRHRKPIGPAKIPVERESTSTAYRHLNAMPDIDAFKSVIKTMRKCKRTAGANTVASYLKMMQRLGVDPGIADRARRRSVRAAAARVAVAAKLKKRGPRTTRDRVIDLLMLGIRQVDIAKKLGISTRQVRKYRRELKTGTNGSKVFPRRSIGEHGSCKPSHRSSHQ